MAFRQHGTRTFGGGVRHFVSVAGTGRPVAIALHRLPQAACVCVCVLHMCGSRAEQFQLLAKETPNGGFCSCGRCRLDGFPRR